jgi:hypothetical protein
MSIESSGMTFWARSCKTLGPAAGHAERAEQRHHQRQQRQRNTGQLADAHFGGSDHRVACPSTSV